MSNVEGCHEAAGARATGSAGARGTRPLPRCGWAPSPRGVRYRVEGTGPATPVAPGRRVAPDRMRVSKFRRVDTSPRSGGHDPARRAHDPEARDHDRGTGRADVGALGAAGPARGGRGLRWPVPLRPPHRAVRRSDAAVAG